MQLLIDEAGCCPHVRVTLLLAFRAGVKPMRIRFRKRQYGSNKMQRSGCSSDTHAEDMQLFCAHVHVSKSSKLFRFDAFLIDLNVQYTAKEG